VAHLESLADADPPLLLDHHPGWSDLSRRVREARRKSELRATEDVVDAVVCAYVALLAGRHPDRLTTYGDVASGFIVTPTLS
jgi:predicted RNase H-like nuclease